MGWKKSGGSLHVKAIKLNRTLEQLTSNLKRIAVLWKLYCENFSFDFVTFRVPLGDLFISIVNL